MDGNERAPRPVIGVLGGMGPAATVDFMAKIIAATPAARDQEHFPVVVWSNPRIPNRNEALQDPAAPSPLPDLIHGARQLEKLGASFIAIACNTAHHWHGEIQRDVAIRILHIADIVIARLAQAGHKPGAAIGLLCSDGTRASGYYDHRLEAAGYVVRHPSDAMQARMMAAIYAVKAGDLGQAHDLALQVCHAVLDAGADVLLLACTELPIALGDAMKGLPCLDVTLCLAEACVAEAQALDAVGAMSARAIVRA